MTHQDRLELRAWMELLIEHRSQLGYPLNDVRGAADAFTFGRTPAEAKRILAAGGTLTGDCSGMIVDIYRWAGLKDPAGHNYRRQGYTGDFLFHLPHYTDPAIARIGAIVVFGPNTGEHGALVLEPGPDPLLFSHGARGVAGPIRLSVERTYHDAPVTFCNVSHL